MISKTMVYLAMLLHGVAETLPAADGEYLPSLHCDLAVGTGRMSSAILLFCEDAQVLTLDIIARQVNTQICDREDLNRLETSV